MAKMSERWAVVGLYWQSRDRWRAWALLALWVLLLLGRTVLQVLFVVFGGETTSALAAQDAVRFWQAVILFIGVIAIGMPVAASSEYLQRRLGLAWRVWLSHWFLDHYLEATAFYQLRLRGSLDNPDQRIEADTRTLSQDCLRYLGLGLESGFQLLGFAGLLWTISPALTALLVGYAAAGTAIAAVGFGRPLVRLNAAQLRREADFRYGLVHLRDHAEAIALYRGEPQEQREIWRRCLGALDNFSQLIRWQLGLNLFQNHYRYATFLLPGLILAPRLVAGELEIGDITQAGTAFNIVLSALGLIVLQLQPLSNLAAAIERLHQLRQALALPPVAFSPPLPPLPPAHPATPIPRHPATLPRPSIHYRHSDTIALEHLTLITPDGSRCLLRELSLWVEKGSPLLIVGASGTGKSSLLRAMAQLWQTGSGTIATPPADQIMVLPQKPYLMAGTLRQQLLYPQVERSFSSDRLIQILHQVNLESLLSQWGGLDSSHPWPLLLSPGEQQRLAFARLLLHQPPWAFLDEATSALDTAHEDQLYSCLQAIATTYISVGHRPTLMIYHRQRLQLNPDLTWHLVPLLRSMATPPPQQGLRQRELCDLFGLDYKVVARVARQQGLSTHAYLQQQTGWQLHKERYYPPKSPLL